MSEIDKQKLRYFGYMMGLDGLEKAIMLGLGEENRERERTLERKVQNKCVRYDAKKKSQLRRLNERKRKNETA